MEKRTKFIKLYLSSNLYDKLTALASESNTTLSKQIRLILTKEVNDGN